jgi:CRISPR-associated endonuclease/helicase Cas3
MRAAMLSRHLIVVDEVHASDTYMASLTQALLSRHLRLGGYALAMSATLGETALAGLQGDRARVSFDTAVDTPYPAIRTMSRTVPLGATPEKTSRVVFKDYSEATELVRATVVDSGKCVLWLRGTVRDALHDFSIFESLGVPAMLHHSRYALEDRSWLDRELMSNLGSGGERHPMVAVTTQTAEQSLDIDADLLVTDACPADVLLQRLGRLHRHRQGTIPTAFFIEPGSDLSAYLTIDGVPHGTAEQGWPWVYRNLLSVRATIDWLRSSEIISVPSDSRRLVELATHADKLRQDAEALGGAWAKLWTARYSKMARDEALAEAGLVDWQEPYRRALVSEAIATRLGEGMVSLAVDDLKSPFTGDAISAIPVPRAWLPKGELPDDLRAKAIGSIVDANGTMLIYDRLGLRPAQMV